jgi:hypothetical protein
MDFFVDQNRLKRQKSPRKMTIIEMRIIIEMLIEKCSFHFLLFTFNAGDILEEDKYHKL